METERKIYMDTRRLEGGIFTSVSLSRVDAIFEHPPFANRVFRFPSSFRQDQVSDDDGFDEGVDAGHVLPQREDREISRHPPAKPLRQSLPQRRRPLLNQVNK